MQEKSQGMNYPDGVTSGVVPPRPVFPVTSGTIHSGLPFGSVASGAIASGAIASGSPDIDSIPNFVWAVTEENAKLRKELKELKKPKDSGLGCFVFLMVVLALSLFAFTLKLADGHLDKIENELGRIGKAVEALESKAKP